MSVHITIANVTEEVCDELALLAALQRQSMQEFLRGELERIASRPPTSAWLQRARERKAVVGTLVQAQSIIRARDPDPR